MTDVMVMDAKSAPEIDGRTYRRVLGQYPTGVCVVTAVAPDGERVGMVVGSFTSVSMDPPLIAFYPARSSTSWPKVEAGGRFCVNILAADQEDTCRAFATSGGDKFAGVPYTVSGLGSPVLDGVVGWIDCEIELVQDAGDHLLVLGRVHDLDLGSHAEPLPLLFFQGGYGRFAPLSLKAADTQGELAGPLDLVEPLRPLMDQFAAEHDCRCIVVTRAASELVVIASAGKSQIQDYQATLIGQRIPYVPPVGAVFAAWDDAPGREEWLRLAVSDHERDRHRVSLELTRDRGYALGLLSSSRRQFVATLDALAGRPFESRPAPLRSIIRDLSYNPVHLTDETKESVRQVSVPVFGPDGDVALALIIYGFGRPRRGIDSIVDGLLDLGAAGTRRIGGQQPDP